MKKKLIVMILVVTTTLSLVGCTGSLVGCTGDSSYSEAQMPTSETEVAAEESSAFVVVEEALQYSIVYHRDTKVMYVAPHGEWLVFAEKYRYNDLTIMLDADGNPLLYEEPEE